MSHSLQNARQRALAYLAANSPNNLSPGEQATILIVSGGASSPALKPYHEKIAAAIAKRLAGEWPKQADLNELCIQFAALQTYNKKLLDGKYFATLAVQLVNAEAATGGPYYNNADSSRPDLETNLMIAYLFHLFEKPLPHVDTFIKSNLATVPALSPLARFAARVMKIPVAPSNSLIDRILQGYSPTTASTQDFLTTLLQAQRPNGSWNDESGTLSPWSLTILALPLLQPTPTQEPVADQRHMARLAEVEAELQHAPVELHPLALAILKDIKRLDTTKEIVLIPYFFADHFPQLNSSLVSLASRANIYCWMAYILYDRLLDGDETPPESLPLMAFAMRRSQALYSQIAPSARALRLAHDTFDTMDSTNAWEVRHTRFTRQGSAIKITALPRYGLRHYLADRSLGHILGPQLLALHLAASPAQHRALQQGLQHFLIARQLHDDIHDWSEDLHSGQASFVVTHLLRKIRVKPGVYQVEALAAKMRTEFWRHSLSDLTSLTIKHASLSKEALLKSGLVPNTSGLINLVGNLQQTAVHAGIEQERYRTFLHEFSRKSEA